MDNNQHNSVTNSLGSRSMNYNSYLSGSSGRGKIYLHNEHMDPPTMYFTVNPSTFKYGYGMDVDVQKVRGGKHIQIKRSMPTSGSITFSTGTEGFPYVKERMEWIIQWMKKNVNNRIGPIKLVDTIDRINYNIIISQLPLWGRDNSPSTLGDAVYLTTLNFEIIENYDDALEVSHITDQKLLPSLRNSSILVTAKDGDTLKSLATKYKVNVNLIASIPSNRIAASLKGDGNDYDINRQLKSLSSIIIPDVPQEVYKKFSEGKDDFSSFVTDLIGSLSSMFGLNGDKEQGAG